MMGYYGPNPTGITLFSQNITIGGLTYPQTATHLPPPYVSGLKYGQAFDFVDDPSVFVGTRSIIWAANQAPVPGVFSTWYYPFSHIQDKTKTLMWFKQNHPDWLVFQNDQESPFILDYYNVALGLYFPELDIQNQEVRDYQIAVGLAELALGYDGLALDNVTPFNKGTPEAPGPIYEPNGIKHRAGVYIGATYDVNGNRLSGVWNQLYDGTTQFDPLWQAAVEDYIIYTRKQINGTTGKSIICNMGITTQDGINTRAQLLAQMQQFIGTSDMYGNESQPQNPHGVNYVDLDWIFFYDLVTNYSNSGGIWWNGGKPTTTTANVSQHEQAWMVANFLLMKGQYSYFSAEPQGFGGYIDYPANWNPPVGYPLGPPVRSGTFASRVYSSGFVAVNGSSMTAASYTVPDTPIGYWADQFYNIVLPGLQQLEPQSGIVLTNTILPRTQLDQGGTFREQQAFHLGPSVGWLTSTGTTVLRITATGNYFVGRGTNLITINIDGDVTINLPPAMASSAGPQAIPGEWVMYTITITDIGGFASTRTYTINPYGPEQIIGLSSIQLSAAHGSIVLSPILETGGWVLI